MCKKCGKIDNDTTEKVCEDNLERVYNVMKDVAKEFTNRSK